MAALADLTCNRLEPSSLWPLRVVRLVPGLLVAGGEEGGAPREGVRARERTRTSRCFEGAFIDYVALPEEHDLDAGVLQVVHDLEAPKRSKPRQLIR